ncbi:MAG: hypothetical protein R2831_05465 [Chitinophagaceae bacterium]
MHDIEPYYNWRHLYTAEEDEQSMFYQREYSEFEYNQSVYNYYIHPQWDEIDSRTLYIKLLYVDYAIGACIIEMIGEWNDVVENDIQTLKRNVIDWLVAKKISKFILIAENVMNAHISSQDYYEEWYEDIRDMGGWIVCLNTSHQVESEFRQAKIHHYMDFIYDEQWRTYKPDFWISSIESSMDKEIAE